MRTVLIRGLAANLLIIGVVAVAVGLDRWAFYSFIFPL